MKDEKLAKPKNETKGALINFKIPLLKRIDAYAKENEVSRIRFVEVACEEYLERKERK